MLRLYISFNLFETAKTSTTFICKELNCGDQLFKNRLKLTLAFQLVSDFCLQMDMAFSLSCCGITYGYSNASSDLSIKNVEIRPVRKNTSAQPMASESEWVLSIQELVSVQLIAASKFAMLRVCIEQLLWYKEASVLEYLIRVHAIVYMKLKWALRRLDARIVSASSKRPIQITFCWG